MTDGFSDVRCTLCGAARILRSDGTPGACSLNGCKDPLHDCSPKQRLRQAVADEMEDMVHRSRKRSDTERALDAALADQRATIVAWLRGMARGARSEGPQPGVDRCEAVEQVAQWIEDQLWRKVLPETTAWTTEAYHAAMADAKRRRKRATQVKP